MLMFIERSMYEGSLVSFGRVRSSRHRMLNVNEN
jgi:hypothetical protein